MSRAMSKAPRGKVVPAVQAVYVVMFDLGSENPVPSSEGRGVFLTREDAQISIDEGRRSLRPSNYSVVKFVRARSQS